jgi:hypothetical protein
MAGGDFGPVLTYPSLPRRRRNRAGVWPSTSMTLVSGRSRGGGPTEPKA